MLYRDWALLRWPWGPGFNQWLNIMADEIEFVSDEEVPKMEKVKRKTVSTSKFRFSLQLIL